MRKNILTLAALSAGVFLSGCVATSGGVNGTIFTSTKAPVSATALNTSGKTGEACSTGVLGFAFGDGSVEAAKQNGQITRVSQVDVKNTSVLGIYAQSCTIVKGE
jgi:hypothetical protein